jgi:hypothetical protein
VTDAPLPEDPRDALIREQAERLAAQDRQLAQAAVQAEQIAVLEAMVADLLERLDAALRGTVAKQRELLDAAQLG